ncbi:MAG TPA: DMT family transporter [Thermoplasmata archaeon]|nr:DMT family transporter [Thermoplasmata archaeon]
MPSGDRRRLYGYLAVSVAAVLFGMWATVAKLVLAQVNELTIVLYTQLIPGLIFLPWLVKHRFPRQDLKFLLGITFVATVVAPILYFFGLGKTTSANAALLSDTESLFTILFAFVFLGERLRPRGYLAIAAIALGAFLVATQLDFTNVAFLAFLEGNLFLIAAACFWGMNNNGITVLSRRNPRSLPMISLQLLIGAALMVPINLVMGAPFTMSPIAAVGVVFLGLTGVGTFTVLFYFAFRTIGAMRTGAVLSTSALWGVLIALAVFPDQGLGFWQIAGGALLVGATVALYVFGEGRPKASPAAGETLKPAGSDGPRSP